MTVPNVRNLNFKLINSTIALIGGLICLTNGAAAQTLSTIPPGTVSNPNSLAIGSSASTTGGTSIAIGVNSTNAIFATQVTGGNGVGIGGGVKISGENNVAIGVNSKTQTTAAGTVSSSVAIGNGAQSQASNATAIGNAALSATSGSTAVGTRAQATGANATTFGTDATASGTNAIATGYQSSAGGTNSLASGYRSSASGANSLAVGANTSATGANSVALGNDSIADQDNTVSVGSATNQRRITNVAAGTSATDAANYGQVQAVQSQLSSVASDLNSFKQETRSGIAATAALVNPVMPSAPGKISVAANMAVFHGETGIGTAFAYRPTVAPTLVHGGFAFAGNETVARIGVSTEF